MKKSPFPRGFITGNIRDTLDRKYLGIEFTTNQFINDGLPDDVREELFAAYGKEATRDKVGQVLAGLTRTSGLQHLQMKSAGQSRWVYGAEEKTPFTEEKSLTFVIVGMTSDGQEIWRNEETKELGWFAWTAL